MYLRILKEPEEQHRARYMSEGSRGAIKDRSGRSHVTIQVRLVVIPALIPTIRTMVVSLNGYMAPSAGPIILL